MPPWVKCENIVKLRKTLSDINVGSGEDDVWLAAGTMIDEFVFYTVLVGQLIGFVSQEVYTSFRCIKVSLLSYERLVVFLVTNNLLFLYVECL